MTCSSTAGWIAIRLGEWGRRGFRRDFPWRSYHDSFRVLLAEILLQQTRASAVPPVLEELLSRFPTWVDLARAPADELEAILRPIGLQRRRSRRILALARVVAGMTEVPRQRAELEALPGVGQYVASAVRALVFGETEAMVDSNVVRIVSRFFGQRERADYRFDRSLQGNANEIVACGDVRETNFLMLDLGASLCRPRNPRCTECPLVARCRRTGVETGT